MNNNTATSSHIVRSSPARVLALVLGLIGILAMVFVPLPAFAAECNGTVQECLISNQPDQESVAGLTGIAGNIVGFILLVAGIIAAIVAVFMLILLAVAIAKRNGTLVKISLYSLIGAIILLALTSAATFGRVLTVITDTVGGIFS